MNNQFSFDLNVVKAEKREGRPVITIYAADTSGDRDGDQCTEQCLEKMAMKAQTGVVDLLTSHYDSIAIGKAINGYVVDAEQFHKELTNCKALMVDVELDFDFPQAKKLYQNANDTAKKDQIKFSIGGRLNRSNPQCIIIKNGKRFLNDIDFDHIAAARPLLSSNVNTFIASSVFKTLDLSKQDEEQFMIVNQQNEAESVAPEITENISEKKGKSFIGSFQSFIQSFYSKPENISINIEDAPSLLAKVVESIDSDYVNKGGDLNELIKNVQTLLQRVSTIHMDTDDMPVRFAKVMSGIEALGFNKPIEAVEEQQPKEKQPQTQLKIDNEGTKDMTQEQIDLLKNEITLQVTQSVKQSIMDLLKEQTVMPKTVEVEEVKPEVATPVVAQEQTEEKLELAAKVNNKISETLGSVINALETLNSRLNTLEKAPGMSTKLTGFNHDTKASNSVFKGVFSNPLASKSI